ncbi:hypothetical protein COY07_02335 [Candidatus Peregrinibacteria bacterium CG_4_10_14_0_2_um_filter_43_11]|nr:MAG: hypothetical protein COY07_02335 [Candidatus Peregrinibacteria bacterium CG_4_10_14_0_2_um_filter_43_11]
MLKHFKNEQSGSFEKNGENRLIFRDAKGLFSRFKPGWQQTADALDKPELPSKYTNGQDILGGKIRQLEHRIEAERKRHKIGKLIAPGTEKNVQTITRKKTVCETKMESLKAPVRTAEEFRNARLEAASYTHFLARLNDTANISPVDLSDLFETDISAFFDEKLEGQIKIANARMDTADKVAMQTTFKMEGAMYLKGAEADYKKEKEVLKTRLKIAKQAKNTTEIEAINRMLESMQTDESGWIRRRAKQSQAEREGFDERQRNTGSIPGYEQFLETRGVADSDETKENYRAYLKLTEGQESPDVQARQTHRHVRAIEEKNLVSLADKLPYEAKMQIANMLLEAREMRMEQMRVYLGNRYEALKNRFETNKARFSEKHRSVFEKAFQSKQAFLALFNGVKGENIDTALENMDQRLDKAEADLDSALSDQSSPMPNLDYIKSNTAEVKQVITQSFEAIRQKIATLTPETIAAIQKQLRKDRIQKLKDAGVTPPPVANDTIKTLLAREKGRKPSDFAKDIQWTNGLPDWNKPGSEKATYLNALTVRIRTLGDTPKPKELQAILVELDTLKNDLGLMEDRDNAKESLDPKSSETAIKAAAVIRQLATVNSAGEIQKILQANFAEHVEYVDQNTFEHYPLRKGGVRNLRDHTGGNMVFYEFGDEWKIIVDREGINNDDPTALANFKAQITHELRHVEFDHDANLQRDQVNRYKTGGKWEEIRHAFVETFPDKRPSKLNDPNRYPEGYKGPYTADDWSDEDMTGELWAMQNDFRSQNIKPGTPADKLSKLMAGLALADTGMSAGDIEEKIHGYDSMGGGGSKASEEGGGGGTEVVGNKSPTTFEEEINKSKAIIKEIGSSEYIGYLPGASDLLHLMNKYNERTRELNEDYRSTSNGYSAEEVEERIKKVNKDLQEMTPKLAEAAMHIKNKKITPFRQLWNCTSFLAVGDMIQVGAQVKEFFQRRHKRKQNDHAARMGQALFSTIPFAGTLASEATARQEKAEQEEVDEWKNRYSSMDAWALKNLLKKAANSIDPNQDQVKAILRILADKGRIDWRDASLWKVLNKLQNVTHLTPDDPVLLHNPPLLRQKLHSATGQIWDYDEFLSLESKNHESYEGQKKKFEATYDSIQDQITERLEQLLNMHMNGQNVDPQEYESGLEYSIKNGKCYAEGVFFYLMAGMATGLLTQDRGLVLDKNLNTWPATQWIYSKRPPLSAKDYKDYCETYFKDDFKKGKPGKEFQNFYWTQVQNDTMTIQRVRKSVSERGWDHDWGRSIAAMGDGHTAKRYLQGRSGQEEAKDTGIENAYVGALQWFEENAQAAEKINFRKEFARQVAWVAVADGIVDNVAYLRENGSAPYTRGNPNILNAIAREAGVGHHGEWTVQQHRNKMHDFMNKLDGTLFGMLRDTESAKRDESTNQHTLAQQIVAHLQANYPEGATHWRTINSLNDVFDNMDLIIQTIFASSRFSDKELLTQIKTLVPPK